jgi:hypothetical protein
MSFQSKSHSKLKQEENESSPCFLGPGLCNNETSIPSCLRCRRIHLKSLLSRVFSQALRLVYKVAVRILSFDSEVQVKLSGFNRIVSLIANAIQISKTMKDKESFKIQSRLIHLKIGLLVDHLSELFFHYSYAKMPNQVNLMTETYILVSNIVKNIQPLMCKCEKSIKNKYLDLFYQKIVKDRKDLHDYLESLKEDNFLLKKLKKMKIRADDEKSSGKNCKHFNFDVSDGSCSYSHKSIDEIVEFIEGVPAQKKKKNRKKKKNTSEEKNFDDDFEILEFSKRIQDVRLGERVKPRLSDEFLQELKEKIRIIKQSSSIN